ncbi:hypothetical protein Tco_0661790 [Tanacetum coccineum]
MSNIRVGGKIPYYTMPPVRNDEDLMEETIVSKLRKEFKVDEVYGIDSSIIGSLKSIDDFNSITVMTGAPVVFDETMVKTHKQPECHIPIQSINKGEDESMVETDSVAKATVKNARIRHNEKLYAAEDESMDSDYNVKVDNDNKNDTAMDLGEGADNDGSAKEPGAENTASNALINYCIDSRASVKNNFHPKGRNMTRPKKYSKLTEAQQLQDDCDVQETNIILHGLPPDVLKRLNDRITRDSSHLINDMHTNVKTISKFKSIPSFLNAPFPLHAVLAAISPQPFISPSVTQHSHAEFPQLDSGLAIPMFQQGEDPIKCISKAMVFLPVVASRFPTSNNQLRTSSNPRNQATIQDGRVTVQQVQRRQIQSYVGTGNRGIATTSKGNYAASQLNTKVQEAGQILDEEQLVFLADPGMDEALVAQQTIPQNSAFQTEDLDAYDSDCNDISSAKVVLMANLSSCDSDVLSEEIDTLKEMLSNHVKEKESLSKTLTVFKTESKEKESKYIDNEFVLEKQNKELENIIYAEQAFWLKHSNHPSVTPVVSHTPVKVEAPRELPKLTSND